MGIQNTLTLFPSFPGRAKPAIAKKSFFLKKYFKLEGKKYIILKLKK